VKGLSTLLRSVLWASMVLTVLCVVSSTDASATTFTSSGSGNWNLSGTWGGAGVPAAGDSVIISAGHTVNLVGATTITGVTVNATGVLATGANTLGVSGNLVVNGAISGTGAITLSGAVTTIDGTGSITNTGILTISAAHTILSTANLTFAGRIAISGAIIVTNNGTVTSTAATGITGTAGGSTWTQGTTGVLNILGPLLATGTLTASANGNTVNYNGAAQTLKGTATYHHLTLSGSGIKTLSATTTAINGNLTMSGTATATTVVGVTVGGGLNVGTGTTFTAAGFALTISGATNVTGTLTISSATGTKAFNGDVTVNTGGIWNNNTANAALTLPGSISNSGTFNAGSGVHTLSGASKTISGTFTIPSVTVTGTYQNNGSLTVTTALAGAGTLTNGAAGTLVISFTGAVGLTNLTATAVGNTVNYGFAGTQTIKATTYYHLTLSTSGAKTAAGGLTVNGDFTIAGTATFAGGTSLTHTFLGNWIVNTTAATPFSFTTASTLNFNTPGTPAATSFSGTSAATLGFNNVNLNNTSGFSSSENFSISGTLTVAANVTFTPSAAAVVSGAGTVAGSGTVKVTRATGSTDFTGQYTITNKTLTNLTVEFAGAATQGNGANTFGGLKLNNSSGLTLSGNVTVNGTLTLASGNITTSSNKVIISSTGSVSRTSGYIVGNLQKNVATGGPARTFEVGDASNYTPVDVSFSSVTSAGDLTVSTTAGDHPNIASSTINAAKSVNRFWTLTNSGIVFTNYSATFNFVSGDLDAGANTNALVIGKFVAAAWSYPTVGTRTVTSTQATGITSFGDFQIGEGATPYIDLQKTVSPVGAQVPGTDLVYTITYTNTGTAAAQTLVITDDIPANTDFKLNSESDTAPGGVTIAVAYWDIQAPGPPQWVTTPTSDGSAPAGYARNITKIRWTFSGNLAVSAGGTLSFTVRIQ
jgi:hypothetical protein